MADEQTPNILDSIGEILDKIDEQLDGITSYMDNLTELLNEELTEKRDQAQAIVNEKMTEFSSKLTDKLQPLRDKLVAIFSAQFAVVKEKVEAYIAPISAFVTIDWSTGTVTPNIPTNPADLANVVTGLILMFIPTPAIEFAVKFATEIYPKILVISNKIQTIATYQPQIEIPDIEVPPLDVNVEPITLADITGENTGDNENV